jgi:8-oxo-dGTP pyrophosphatase MutT (NUDIX family)
MNKTTSFGVLLLNEHSQLLVAHVTGQSQWDIPKGGGHPGELAEDSARRELLEETGIILPVGALTDLGVHDYYPHKDLHLFWTRVASTDCEITACVCTSFFVHRHSREVLPEMDAFRWIEISDIPDFCLEKMSNLALKLLAQQTDLRLTNLYRPPRSREQRPLP